MHAEQSRSIFERWGKRMVVGVAAFACAVTLAGCSSSASGPGGGSTSGSATVSQATLTKLKAAVTRAEQAPTFTPPGDPVDVAAVKGKTVYAFPINNEIDTCNHQAAFLGLTTIQPGRFNAIGTGIAVYFLAFGVSGFQLLGAQIYIQQIFYGVILAIAILLSRVLSSRRYGGGGDESFIETE